MFQHYYLLLFLSKISICESVVWGRIVVIHNLLVRAKIWSSSTNALQCTFQNLKVGCLDRGINSSYETCIYNQRLSAFTSRTNFLQLLEASAY
jgi:hypothetical protein